jgi:hypothetical protein
MKRIRRGLLFFDHFSASSAVSFCLVAAVGRARKSVDASGRA